MGIKELQKWLVLKLPFKTMQGHGRATKDLAFGSDPYRTATTLPILNGSLRTRRYPFIPLFKF